MRQFRTMDTRQHKKMNTKEKIGSKMQSKYKTKAKTT